MAGIDKTYTDSYKDYKELIDWCDGVESIIQTLRDGLKSLQNGETLPKKGQIVWVRDNNIGDWVIRHFIKISSGRYGCSQTNNEYNVIFWNQLTTKNPYETDEDIEPEIGDMVYAWSNEDEPPTYGELIKLNNDKVCINPLSSHLETFKYCSLENPLIK